MKKTYIITIICFTTLFASNQLHAQFAVGIKAGYNASSISTSLDSIKSSISSGFHAGVFARIGKRVQLQPEIYYTVSGSLFESKPNSLNSFKQKITIGTLDIPVLLSFAILKTKVVKWRIMVGPEASFLVNSKVENVTLTGPIEKSDLRSINWFIQAGTGIDILRFTLDLRYQAGLNSLIGDVAWQNKKTYPINSKSNLFVVSLGFKII